MRIPSTGANIAVDVDPPKPTQVLLVHGGPGAPAEFQLIRSWPNAWHVGCARYDQRGVHRSSCDDNRWGLEAQVADLESVRQATADDQVVVLGHSFGGLVALAWAQTHPSRVKGLLLSSPALAVGADFKALQQGAADTVRRGLTKEQWRRLALASVKSYLPGVYGDRAMGEVYGLVLQAYTGAPPPAWVANCSARATRKTRDAIARESPQRWDFTDLKERFPISIVMGDRDVHGPTYLTQATRIAGTEPTVLTDCGHVLWHNQPDAFKTWLKKGLQTCGLCPTT